MTTLQLGLFRQLCDKHALGPTARLVVRTIADFAYGSRDVAWPSNRTIASLVGRSLGHIRRLISKLVALGILVRRPAENRTGREFLLPFKTQDPEMTPSEPRAGGARPQSPPCAPVAVPPGSPARTELMEACEAKKNGVTAGSGSQATPAVPPEGDPDPGAENNPLSPAEWAAFRAKLRLRSRGIGSPALDPSPAPLPVTQPVAPEPVIADSPAPPVSPLATLLGALADAPAAAPVRSPEEARAELQRRIDAARRQSRACEPVEAPVEPLPAPSAADAPSFLGKLARAFRPSRE